MTQKIVIKDKRRDYTGKEITVHDNRKICSHAAECVNNLSSVFKLGSRPWINPDASKMNDIIEVVRRCPSGASSVLSMELNIEIQSNKEIRLLRY